VEECILARNVKHFGQAEGSLFTTTVITKLLDYEGTSPQVANLLRGNIELPNIPNITKSAISLLQPLSNEKHLEQIDNNIYFSEFKRAFA
jgi:hypothetical protein